MDYFKTAGHYAVLVPSSEDDLQFGKVNWKNTKNSKTAELMYRYSYFEEGKEPLSAISLSE